MCAVEDSPRIRGAPGVCRANLFAIQFIKLFIPDNLVHRAGFEGAEAPTPSSRFSLLHNANLYIHQFVIVLAVELLLAKTITN